MFSYSFALRKKTYEYLIKDALENVNIQARTSRVYCNTLLYFNLFFFPDPKWFILYRLHIFINLFRNKQEKNPLLKNKQKERKKTERKLAWTCSK